MTRGFAGTRCSTGGSLPAFTRSASSGDSLNLAGVAACAAVGAAALETASVGAAPAAVGAAACATGLLAVVLPVAPLVAVGAVLPPPHAVTAPAAATAAESRRNCRRLIPRDAMDDLPDSDDPHKPPRVPV